MNSRRRNRPVEAIVDPPPGPKLLPQASLPAYVELRIEGNRDRQLVLRRQAAAFSSTSPAFPPDLTSGASAVCTKPVSALAGAVNPSPQPRPHRDPRANPIPRIQQPKASPHPRRREAVRSTDLRRLPSLPAHHHLQPQSDRRPRAPTCPRPQPPLRAAPGPDRQRHRLSHAALCSSPRWSTPASTLPCPDTASASPGHAQ